MKGNGQLPADPRFKGATPEKLALALKKKKKEIRKKIKRVTNQCLAINIIPCFIENNLSV
ncbi:MAG: hypothetical protein OXI37_03565 [Gammaproteobacteria bacterium]|nr:hypothetical protein [Gammaproteobacteria bacterium]